MQTPERKPPTAVIFDSSLDESIDQVLALAMVLAYDISKREARLGSISVSRNSLPIAAFSEAIVRFYRGEQPGESPSRNAVTIGMHEQGTAAAVPPMISSVLARKSQDRKPLYPRGIEKLNDTADPVAVIRNALSAQQDQGAVIVLAGPPVNLLGLLAIPDGKALVQKKARALAVGARFTDVPGFTKLLAEWPGPIIVAGEELNDMQVPSTAIEQDFTWAANHPVVDVCRSAKAMPYDIPVHAMAAVLEAVHPEENFFKRSEPGTLTVSAGGRTQFNAGGRHRQLMVDAAQKDRVVQLLRQTVASKPPEPRRGTRGAQA